MLFSELIVPTYVLVSYLQSVECLQAESNISLKKTTVADNVDLLTIIQEFESYYNLKFGKAPKLCRKASGGDDPPNPKPIPRKSIRKSSSTTHPSTNNPDSTTITNPNSNSNSASLSQSHILPRITKHASLTNLNSSSSAGSK
ncbi:Katanin p60 ATPase-containing subunit A-like 2, partial [Quaeritorhiza haematococci]